MLYNCQCWPARLRPLAMNTLEEMCCRRACNFECVYNSNFRGLSISTSWKEQVKQLSLLTALKFIPVLSSWQWVNDGHASRITRVICAWWATWCTICCIFVPQALRSSSMMTRNKSRSENHFLWLKSFKISTRVVIGDASLEASVCRC